MHCMQREKRRSKVQVPLTMVPHNQCISRQHGRSGDTEGEKLPRSCQASGDSRGELWRRAARTRVARIQSSSTQPGSMLARTALVMTRTGEVKPLSTLVPVGHADSNRGLKTSANGDARR